MKPLWHVFHRTARTVKDFLLVEKKAKFQRNYFPVRCCSNFHHYFTPAVSFSHLPPPPFSPLIAPLSSDGPRCLARPGPVRRNICRVGGGAGRGRGSGGRTGAGGSAGKQEREEEGEEGRGEGACIPWHGRSAQSTDLCRFHGFRKKYASGTFLFYYSETNLSNERSIIFLSH